MGNSLSELRRGGRGTRLMAWRVAAAAGMALGAFVLTGCDGESDATVAIRTAAIKLEAMAPAGTGPASEAARRQVYGDVAQSLSKVATAGTPSENATAQVLLAEAQSGLAQLQATEASRLESEALNLQRRLRAAQADWTVRSARAAASEAYDPAPEFAEIDAQVAEKQQQIQAEESRRAEVQSRIDGLRAESEAMLARASEGHANEGRLRQQSLEASAVDGARLLEEAVRVKRDADALEVEAGNLEAQAAKIEPQIGEIDLTIEKLRKQIADLAAAKADVEARAQSAREDASQSRQAAAAIAGEIDEMAAELAALRSGPIAEAHQEAARLYGAAISAARNANKDSRAAAQLALGKAQQSLGDVHWTRAQGLTAYANTLTALAETQPPLPRAQEFAAAAEAARAQAAEALTAAGEAYTAAHGAYGSAGAKGEAAQRVESLQGRLSALANTVSDGSIDLGAAEDSEVETSQADPVETADTAGPAAAVDALLDAVRANRFPAVAEHIHLADRANRDVLVAVLDAADAFVRLNEALKSQYGQGLMDIAAQQPGGIPGLPPGVDPNAMMGEAFAELETASSADFTFDVTGDTATAIPNESGEPLQLRRIDGRWLVDLTPLESMIGAQPQAAQYRQLVMMAVPQIVEATRQTVTEIEAGQYDSAQTAINALNLKMQPIMFQIMGKMQELGIQMPGMGPGGG